MRACIFSSLLILFFFNSSFQILCGQEPAKKQTMTPELLWKVQRVSGTGISKDGKNVIYRVSTPSVEENKFSSKTYTIPVTGGQSSEINIANAALVDKNISPDGHFKVTHQSVKVEPVHGYDFHPDLKKSTAQIYTALDYRHWDTWNYGDFNHVIYGPVDAPDSTYTDIMKGEAYHCPQKPFGGDEDYIWSSDSKSIIYVSKKLSGTKAAQSTNTDIYQYNIITGKTTNLTADNKGYDTHPLYSVNGDLAYLSMKTDGFEADKNDIKVISNGITTNLTARWDESVNSFIWAADGKSLYFIAAVDGTLQVFNVDFPGMTKKLPVVTQITKGDWDVNNIIGLSGDLLIISRLSMNRAAEIYSFNLSNKIWTQLSDVNRDIYSSIGTCRTERRMVKTTDSKNMLVWVVYPPDFDPKKKYPALLYCQGGPQSALTQFYSYRWNLHLMASQGYIVVAPNRRGMPGHGVKWNKQISKDWGGQNIRDLYSAIDHMAKEPFVDKNRLGAVGASYGGYSVFYMAGTHKNRFKTFIAHDGIFNTVSMYGTTEEIFFVNYDLGGPYWQKKTEMNMINEVPITSEIPNKSYTKFNPINHVHKWNTPIYIIQGGKDYRVSDGQSMEAFNAAQIKGIKSKFLYLPDENHWVIKPQNSIVWQREFFKWLKETL
ncbi:MAG: S9 family peptidase [Saprospiraceae bacterium]|nr:S9 family peptidase [Saprospiraceae bacterium]